MVYSVDLYDNKGKVVWKIDLNKDKYSDEKINKTLIHEYYLLQQSNARNTIAHTKGRWEVAGSGKKLYRQKGTGNARVWDRRSPIRVWGWVSRGPRNTVNFVKSMNKKSKRLALNGLITIKAKSEDIVALKDLKMDTPKTKDAVAVIDNLKLSWKKVLVVVKEKDENVLKSLRNIDRVKYLLVEYLNPVDLLSYEKVVIFESALESIN